MTVLVTAATGECIHSRGSRRRETKQLLESQFAFLATTDTPVQQRGSHEVRMGLLKPHPTRACEQCANARRARVCPRWTGVCYLDKQNSLFAGLYRSPLTDSNRRPPPYHGGALPTELRGRRRGVYPVSRFGPRSLLSSASGRARSRNDRRAPLHPRLEVVVRDGGIRRCGLAEQRSRQVPSPHHEKRPGIAPLTVTRACPWLTDRPETRSAQPSLSSCTWSTCARPKRIAKLGWRTTGRCRR